MIIQLDRPLCVFDLETTGLDISKDRIVQIAILKIHPDGKKEELNLLINPEMNISESNAAIHGITNEIVKNEIELSNFFKKNLISNEIIIGMGAGLISKWIYGLKTSL